MRQQKKKPKSWQTVVEEYLNMCKKAIIGEEVKHNDNRNEGLRTILSQYLICTLVVSGLELEY